MQRKELLQKSGLSEKAVRYYEKQGLITIASINGKKLYTEHDLMRLRKIKWLREHGFSTQEILCLFSNAFHQALIEEKIRAYDASILHIHKQKEEMIQLLHTKEIPMADNHVQETLTSPYMMVVNMDHFMGWLNVSLLVIAALIALVIRTYVIMLPGILLLVCISCYVYKVKLVPEMEQYQEQVDHTISLNEVLSRSLINVSSHICMCTILVWNGMELLYGWQRGSEAFLELCSIMLCVLPTISMLIISVKQNFQYRRYYH